MSPAGRAGIQIPQIAGPTPFKLPSIVPELPSELIVLAVHFKRSRSEHTFRPESYVVQWTIRPFSNTSSSSNVHRSRADKKTSLVGLRQHGIGHLHRQFTVSTPLDACPKKERTDTNKLANLIFTNVNLSSSGSQKPKAPDASETPHWTASLQTHLASPRTTLQEPAFPNQKLSSGWVSSLTSRRWVYLISRPRDRFDK